MKSKEPPVIVLAKAFADSGRSFMSESELAKMIFNYAQLDRRAHESEHQAFARVFAGNSAEALVFRKAIAVCNAVGPMPFGGNDDAGRAYARLQKLGDQERARDPRLTEAQGFAKAANQHPELLARAVPR
jgi:hypothetical protein